MRAKLRKLIWAMLEACVAEHFPAFSDHPVQSGRVAWMLQISEDLFLFIFAYVGETDDRFAIELQWNSLNEIPYASRLDLSRADGGCRIQQLSGWNNQDGGLFDLDPAYTQGRKYYMKHMLDDVMPVYPKPTDPDILLKAAPAIIQDALDKLTEHGPSFFRNLCAAHGAVYPE